MTKLFAGIGSRKTPNDIIKIMEIWARYAVLCEYGVSTGAALGADQAFARGAKKANGLVHLHLPWAKYEQEFIQQMRNAKGITNVYVYNPYTHPKAGDSVVYFHPEAQKLKQGPFKLHARNYNILTLPQLVEHIVCWTPEGKITGGTGQALRIAAYAKIPVYNLGNPDTLTAFIDVLKNYGLL